jgi:hypothetical protein
LFLSTVVLPQFLNADLKDEIPLLGVTLPRILCCRTDLTLVTVAVAVTDRHRFTLQLASRAILACLPTLSFGAAQILKHLFSYGMQFPTLSIFFTSSKTGTNATSSGMMLFMLVQWFHSFSSCFAVGFNLFLALGSICQSMPAAATRTWYSS